VVVAERGGGGGGVFDFILTRVGREKIVMKMRWDRGVVLFAFGV
jgi:hypothetical protein